jgi:hypothetical protein
MFWNNKKSKFPFSLSWSYEIFELPQSKMNEQFILCLQLKSKGANFATPILPLQFFR